VPPKEGSRGGGKGPEQLEKMTGEKGEKIWGEKGKRGKGEKGKKYAS
jgi:hypothetical protein